ADRIAAGALVLRHQKVDSERRAEIMIGTKGGNETALPKRVSRCLVPDTGQQTMTNPRFREEDLNHANNLFAGQLHKSYTRTCSTVTMLELLKKSCTTCRKTHLEA